MACYRDPVFFLFICQHLRPYCSGLFRCDIALGRILVIQTHLVSSIARHLKHTGQVSFVFRLFSQTYQTNLNKADHFLSHLYKSTESYCCYFNFGLGITLYFKVVHQSFLCDGQGTVRPNILYETRAGLFKASLT